MIDLDTESFFAISLVAAISATLVSVVGRWLVVPVVVVELLLGIVIGPEVLGLAKVDDFVAFFSNLGLAMLFFFAGYEIDFERIKGSPLRLALIGWLISLALAYAVGGLLALAGVVLSLLFTGTALATTAIGTLIPVLRDAGEVRTRFGTYLLAAGALGEFGPIVFVTVLLSANSPLHNAALLIVFVAVATAAAVLAIRSAGAGWEAFERTLETSSQLAVRWTMVMILALVALAAGLGLDVLLGGFVAGIIVSLIVRGREAQVLESKLTAVGYGFLVPFFFVYSGVSFDLSALLDDPILFLKLPLFLALFLIVRGVPALLLYRRAIELRDRVALGFYSATALPLVVAITTIAVDEGHMRSATGAALVGAAVLSTAIYPLIALHLRRGRQRDDTVAATA